MTARDDPRGIGHVLESDLLAGRLRLDAAERIPDERIERLVLAVTIERLLNHDIALRERLPDGDYLVFPSEYTRTAPYPRRNAPGVAFDFQGAIRAIFTTLVVRLAHHGDFKNVEFYRDAASYETRTQERGERGGRCAVVLDETAPGQGRMSVYFEDDPGQAEQQSFLHFVRQHLEAKAKPDSVHLHRLYFCRACGHALDELAVQNRLKQGSKDIGCPNCDERTPLFDLLIAGDAEARADAQRMDTDADTAHSRQLAATAIEGKKRIGEYDVFLSYSTKDRDKVVALAEALVALGIRPWLDVWDLVPGQPWQVGLNEAIQHVNAAAVCVGPSGTGPWQDHEVMAFIRQFVKRESPVIPVLLPGAASHVALPPLLDSFLWVDVREFSLANPRPLANLVAGIFGRRPRAMDPERLADQVAAILAAPPARPVPDEAQEIVLPVNRGALNDTEVEALRQQTARLLVPALPDRSRAVHHREWVH
jgi:nucleotide-binding universal stress UspA family protein